METRAPEPARTRSVISSSSLSLWTLRTARQGLWVTGTGSPLLSADRNRLYLSRARRKTGSDLYFFHFFICGFPENLKLHEQRSKSCSVKESGWFRTDLLNALWPKQNQNLELGFSCMKFGEPHDQAPTSRSVQLLHLRESLPLRCSRDKASNRTPLQLGVRPGRPDRPARLCS